jgi:5-methylcytosine-specific restriction enzyme A
MTGNKPLRPCRHPGCKELSTSTYCEKHKAEGKPWAKKNEPKRMRGRKSQARRERIAERDGFICQMCGRVTSTGIADHIIPLAFGGEDIEENMQWLCPNCHQVKTKEESKGGHGGA